MLDAPYLYEPWSPAMAMLAETSDDPMAVALRHANEEAEALCQALLAIKVMRHEHPGNKHEPPAPEEDCRICTIVNEAIRGDTKVTDDPTVMTKTTADVKSQQDTWADKAELEWSLRAAAGGSTILMKRTSIDGYDYHGQPQTWLDVATFHNFHEANVVFDALERDRQHAREEKRKAVLELEQRAR